MSEENNAAESQPAEAKAVEATPAPAKPRARRTTRAKKAAAEAAAPASDGGRDEARPSRAADNGRDEARPSRAAEPVAAQPASDNGRDEARPSQAADNGRDEARPSQVADNGRDEARPSQVADGGHDEAQPSPASEPGGPGFVRAAQPAQPAPDGGRDETTFQDGTRAERLAKWGRFSRGRGRFRDRRNRFHNDQQPGQPDGQMSGENGGEGQPQEERQPLPTLKLWELESMSLEALNEKLEGFFSPEEIAGSFRKHDVINDFIRAYMRRGGSVITNGVIEIMNDGFGFLRSEKASYLACPEDVCVAPNYVRRFNLRTGDFVEGPIRDPRERPERGKEKYLALGRIESVNGRPPAEWRRIIPFENLTPIFPTRRIQLERIAPAPEPTDISMRFVDLFAPIGFGQRGLIVAPPRTGKTVLLQKVANAITANYPDAYLIVLLIDERPEEVTDMERNTEAHVLASTFDEAPERHAQVAEMAIEMAKRKVESGMDVVILLDSITRLARAYNTLAPHSGKILSGGVDANAMFKPKRFFGAARNIEGGGSLTIIATALIETGSRMDEVIFEEFKGTGNMELVLDRQLSDRRIFPAINVTLSGTRKEELIVTPPELNFARSIRNMLNDSTTPADSMDNVIKRMKKFNSNADFIMQKLNY